MHRSKFRKTPKKFSDFSETINQAELGRNAKSASAKISDDHWRKSDVRSPERIYPGRTLKIMVKRSDEISSKLFSRRSLLCESLRGWDPVIATENCVAERSEGSCWRGREGTGVAAEGKEGCRQQAPTQNAHAMTLFLGRSSGSFNDNA